MTHISEENGLSDNHVQCVFKDKEGLIWIGTSDGLNRMDGSTIKIFMHDTSNVQSIANNNILALNEDSKGNLLVGTKGGGLCILDKKKQTFKSVIPPKSPYGAEIFVSSVVSDQGNNVWCTTDGGLYLYHPATGKMEAFFNPLAGDNNKNWYCNKISQAILSKDNRIWLATFDGVWSFDIKTHQYKSEINEKNVSDYKPLFISVFEDHDQNIWAGTWDKGLLLKKIKTDSVFTFDHLNNHPGIVNCINEIKDNNGKYIIWLNGRLQFFDPEEKVFFKYPSPVQLSEEIEVLPRYKSADDWVWLSSPENGLYFYNPQKQIFQHRFFNQNITSQNIVFNEWNHQLVVGGQGSSFLKLYDKKWTLKDSFNFRDDGPHQYAASLALNTKLENDWWMGTSEGILNFNPAKKTCRWFNHKKGDSSSVPSNFISCLLLDAKKQLWFFPWRLGIWKMDIQTGKCSRLFKNFITEQGYPKGLVIADAVEDQWGNIWMADLDEGIICYSSSKNEFSKPFQSTIGVRCHSSRIFIQKGYCYAITDYSILKWNPQNLQLEVFKLPAEINKEIFDFTPDSIGNWWIATANGLIAFNEQSKSFKKFTTNDGLAKNDMNGNIYCSSEGIIYFGAANYISSFNPVQLLNEGTVKKPVFISSILINGAIEETADNHSLILDYNNNNIIFNWAMADYTNPFQNHYYCKLEGIDSNWRYVGNKGEIQYAHLSPGNYQVLLKATNANGLPASNIEVIQLVILAPVWERWWFILSSLLLVILLVAGIIRNRILKIKKRVMIQQQLSELELKALRAQMNPHFIFNSLSSIQESIINNKTEAAAKYLGKFSKLIRMVLENSGKTYITLTDEIDYLKLYLELESFRFENFSYSIEINQELTKGIIYVPTMIVQPYVENAIKHGLAHQTGDKKLLIQFRLDEEKQLWADITDNGIGRKKSAEINAGRAPGHHSMGMQITEERLSLLQQRHQGQIIITDLYDSNNQPSGTRISVPMPTHHD